MTSPLNPRQIDRAPAPAWVLPSQRQFNRLLRRYWLSLSIVLGAVALGCLPYQVRPGGRIQLLPQNQQRVQAKVAGQIDRVFINGGDGEIIPAGTVLATLNIPDLEKQQQTIQERIEAQTALMQAAQADLERLRNLPRPEQVTVSRRQVEVANQQILVTISQLDTAKTQARFSRDEAERYAGLYAAGGISEQLAEDFQSQAHVDQGLVTTLQANVLEQRQQLQQKQAELDAVLSGASKDEIRAAEAHRSAAEAEIRQLEQELKFIRDEVGRAHIHMPIDGHLVDQRLSDKIGTYLEQGDTFAVAESSDDTHLRGEVQVPEVLADQLAAGRALEIKLLAFPNHPIQGQVIAIEPSVSLQETERSQAKISGDTVTVAEDAAGRMLNVIVELPNWEGRLRPGMTGYAKIDGTTMPLAAAFSRSLIRFFKVEVWSWLP